MDSVINNTKKRMNDALKMLHEDFMTVRTGKASPTLIENIVISAYGGTAKLRVMELATIMASDPQTLIITPFDSSVTSEIERGIADAKVGLNPIVDGKLLRINLPPLTEERRLEFVKLVSQKAEQGKIMIRQARHDGMSDIKKGSEELSEDEITRYEKDIQKLTDEYIDKIEQMKKEKEEELMRM